MTLWRTQDIDHFPERSVCPPFTQEVCSPNVHRGQGDDDEDDEDEEDEEDKESEESEESEES